LILDKKQKTKQQMDISMIVLVGFGVIDILFKQIASTTTFYFVLVCRFAISLVVMILVVIYERVVKK
jgi:hypothetical protein